MSKNTIRKLRERLNSAVSKFREESRNNDMSMLRGYIRRHMREVSYVDKITKQRIPNDDDSGIQYIMYTMLENILGKTKEAMNGVNILKQKICSFRDKEENYWCMEPIGNNHEFCKEHHDVVKAMKK